MSTAPDFDEWVVARGQPLLRLAYVLTADPAEAEEIVEDALSRALPRWSRISRISRISRGHDPDAYLRRLVVRAHVSRWRRFRHRHAPPPPPPPEPLATTGVTIEIPDLIWPACESLPWDQRTALVLRYYEGLSDEEIAELMGVREESVRTQVSHGIAAVKAQLAEP